MFPLNPFFSIAVFIICYITAWALRRAYKIPLAGGSRYDSVDGLRGFLALSVFIHHATVWHQYLHSGNWDFPKSNLYTQFGMTGVSLFFMITSFLFITKLLDAKGGVINWKIFFVSRLFRILPMYLVSLFFIVFIIMYIGNWRLNVSYSKFVMSILDYSFCAIRQTPLINNFENTKVVNAGVVWSLKYEWLFYFSLPLISLLILKVKPKLVYIIAGMLFLVFFYKHNEIIKYHLFAFLGGAVAALLRKFVPRLKNLNDWYVTPLILICLFLIGQFSTAFNGFCVALISIIFIFVALGSSLNGLLKNETLKFLGEICYSTYILHGIILFWVFGCGIGIKQSRQLTPGQYCLVIFAIAPIVVIISFFGYRLIEKPFMDKGKRISAKLNPEIKLQVKMGTSLL
jgi:peptidoglycan/LPS O-acetylase OafA/YrhL